MRLVVPVCAAFMVAVCVCFLVGCPRGPEMPTGSPPPGSDVQVSRAVPTRTASAPR